MNCILRKGNLQDVGPVMGILRRVVPAMQAEGNLQWDERYPNADVFVSDVENGALWIAMAGEALAGVAAITSDQSPEYADVGWDLKEPAVVVHRLAVDVAFRGQGIARALMEQAENIAADRGVTVMRIDTNTQNRATQQLFPRLGYRFCGEISLRFRNGLRFYCYEKRLV